MNSVVTMAGLITPGVLKTGFNIALFVIIAIIILGGVLGMIRGVFNEGFRLLFMGTLVLLCYLFSSNVSDWLANYHIGGLFRNINFVVYGQRISLTSIKETLHGIITACTTSNNSFISSSFSNPDSVLLIEEVVMLLVRFVTFVIMGIIVIIIGNLLCTMFYHFLIKLFIPRKLRKRVKLRVLSFFMGMVKTALVASLVIIPLTSILNTINQAFKDKDNTAHIDNELYKTIMSWIDAYDDSLLAQALFNWTTDENGNTFDMNLINAATAGGEAGLVFTDEIGALASMANAVIGSGALSIDGDTTTIDLTLLLNSNVISTIISSMLSSTLIMSVLPLVATIALSIDEVAKVVDVSKINLEEMNFAEELMAIDNIYKEFSQAQIFDFTDSDHFLRQIMTSSFKNNLVAALKGIDQSKLLSTVIPAVLYKLTNTPQANGKPSVMSNYLPTEWEDYQEIKWGQEFAIIYDCVYEMNLNTDDAIIDKLAPLPEPEPQVEVLEANRFKAIAKFTDTEEPIEQKEKTLVEIIIENSDKIMISIVGNRDSEGNPITDAKGKSLPEDGSCLLDSDLLVKSIEKIIKLVLDTFVKEMSIEKMEEEEIQEIVDSLNDRYGYKKEFGAMLEIVADVLTNEFLSGIQEESLDLRDAEVKDALRVVLPKVDNSVIMTRMLPDVLKDSFKGIDDDLAQYDLKSDDFEYEVPHFGTEMVNLLDAYDYMMELDEAFVDKKDHPIKNINPTSLKNLLDTFYRSPILNPNKDVDGAIHANLNYYKVIDYMFTAEGLEIEHVTNRVSNLDEVVWLDSQVDNKTVFGENHRIAEFFATLQSDDLVAMFSDDDFQIHDSSKLNPVRIEELFNRVDESKVISVSFGTVLDRVLLPQLDLGAVDISFENVYDWSTEGKNLRQVVEGVQKINKALSEVSWINENPTYTNDILTAFSYSQAFTDRVSGDNQFGAFMFDTMKKALPEYLKDYKKNKSDGIKTYVMAEIDFQGIIVWEPEIAAITDLIAEIQSHAPSASTLKGEDGLSRLEDGSLSAAEIDSILTTINDATTMRMVNVNAIDNIVNDDTMGIGGVTLQDTHLEIFIPMDKDNRQVEIDYIVEIYDVIEMMKLKNGFTITDVEGDGVKILLDNLHDSKLFNTFKEVIQELSVFEQVVKMIIKETDFDDKILDEHETIAEKIHTIKNNYTDTQIVDDGWMGEAGENLKIGEIVTSFKNTEVTSFVISADDMEALVKNDDRIDALNGLLKSMNNSELFYEGIPNFMDDLIEKDMFVADGLQINNTLINTNYNNGARYEETEIEKLTAILKSTNKFNDIVDDKGEKIEDPNLRDYDIEQLDILMNQLHDSRIFNTVKGVTRQQTFFENFMGAIVIKAEIDVRITSNERSLNDILFAIGNSIAIAEDRDGWSGSGKEISRITDLLAALQHNGIENGDIASKEAWTEDEVYDTLSALNNSKICYRSVPSYIDELVDNKSVDDIDLDATNSRYNDDLAYEDGEIDVIAKIYSSLDDITDMFDELNDLSKLDNEKIARIKVLLKNFADSQIFHKSGSDVGSLNTVLEQMIVKLLMDSTLGTLAHDNALFIEDLSRTAVMKSQVNTVSYSSVVSANSNVTWEHEIDNLFAIIDTVRLNTTITTIDTIDFSKLTPVTVDKIMVALNESELVYYAVPSQTKELFTSISIDTMTENHEKYLMDKSNYRQVYQTHEIADLIILLEKIYDEDTKTYLNFGQNFDVIKTVSEGISAEAIIAYLSSSDIFRNCRGLTLYNIIDTGNYGRYVRTEYDQGIKNVFDQIFDLIEDDESQVNFEGAALDEIIVRLVNFNGISFKNLNPVEIKSLYQAVYNGQQIAMIAAEVMSGYLNQSLLDTNYIHDGYAIEWFKVNNEDFKYPLYNDIEANGLSGIIRLLNLADTDYNDSQQVINLNIQDFEDTFDGLETENENSIIASALYQKGFYVLFQNSLSNIYGNADIFFAGDTANRDKMTSNYEAMSSNPFADGFHFHTEKEKVINILEAVKR